MERQVAWESIYVLLLQVTMLPLPMMMLLMLWFGAGGVRSSCKASSSCLFAKVPFSRFRVDHVGTRGEYLQPTDRQPRILKAAGGKCCFYLMQTHSKLHHSSLRKGTTQTSPNVSASSAPYCQKKRSKSNDWEGQAHDENHIGMTNCTKPHLWGNGTAKRKKWAGRLLWKTEWREVHLPTLDEPTRRGANVQGWQWGAREMIGLCCDQTTAAENVVPRNGAQCGMKSCIVASICDAWWATTPTCGHLHLTNYYTTRFHSVGVSNGQWCCYDDVVLKWNDSTWSYISMVSAATSSSVDVLPDL